MIPYPDDVDYASTRLNSTIVRHKGELVEVRGMTNDTDQRTYWYHEYDIKTPRLRPKNAVLVKKISKGDDNGGWNIVRMEDLDVNPLILGYVNTQTVASYVIRRPLRHDWRQGNRYSNMTTTQGLPVNTIPYSSLIDTVKGTFPSFEEVVTSLKTVISKAWSRDWCALKDNTICYRGRIVGNILDGRPVLVNKFIHLQESLDESY